MVAERSVCFEAGCDRGGSRDLSHRAAEDRTSSSRSATDGQNPFQFGEKSHGPAGVVAKGAQGRVLRRWWPCPRLPHSGTVQGVHGQVPAAALGNSLTPNLGESLCAAPPSRQAVSRHASVSSTGHCAGRKGSQGAGGVGADLARACGRGWAPKKSSKHLPNAGDTVVIESPVARLGWIGSGRSSDHLPGWAGYRGALEEEEAAHCA